MSQTAKLSRCGFAVIRFRIDEDDYLLLRKNLKWRDVSLLGGHEIPRDNGSLLRAARRELSEEVPALRSFRTFELHPLTDEIVHGPIYSPSARAQVKYVLQFFWVQFNSDPLPVIESLGPRTPNLLMRQSNLKIGAMAGVSGLIQLLDKKLVGGLSAIPYSWSSNLSVGGHGYSLLDQHELSWG